ncbi:sensor histidine kinase [Nonomuraea candida]|uniref:sensor histidine kinase n=1 Tax=Nonomuraea candida TaxID=359159 RepID=UPI000694087E|nr:histidine kinase [Nonomuraea candida]
MAARPETARKLLLYWMDGSIVLVFVLLAIFTVGIAAEGRISLLRMAVVLALLVGFSGLYPFILREAFDRRPEPTRKLMVAGVLVAGLAVLVPPAQEMTAPWVSAVSLWLSLAALYLRPRAIAALIAVTMILVTGYLVLVTGASWPRLLIGETATAVILTGTMLLWRWIWWAIRDANRSREARARLAVAEERLRFARDLHDLLGRSLSVITLKSELAAKLATKDAGRSAAEMAAVRELAADALAEVQQAVHGYQHLDLDEELAGVRAALEAAGTSCVIEARTDGLSPAARTLLAWAVREGGTNILKHSSATRCAIRIDGGVLEMVNDGVARSPARPGNGLHGLAERLNTAGGSFSAEPTPSGEFLLRAAVPA